MNHKSIQNKHTKIKPQNYKGVKINNYPTMTAKLRKELAEQKRAGRDAPADAQAVGMVEQTGAAAFEEVGREAERLVDRGIHPGRQAKERAETIKGNGQRPQERHGAGHTGQSGEAISGPSRTRVGPETTPRQDAPATPGERMKRQAAKDLERTRQAGEFPQGHGAPPTSPHYGGHPPGQSGSKDAFLA